MTVQRQRPTRPAAPAAPPASAAERRRRRAARERRMRRRRVRALVVAACVVLIAGGSLMTAIALVAAKRPSAVEWPVTSAGSAASSPVVVALRGRVDPAQAAARKSAQATSGIEGLAPLQPAPGVKTIVVDKSSQTVALYGKDGQPIDRFQCASGQLYPRVGTYKVTSRKPASMSTYDNTRFYHFVIFTVSDKGTNIGFHSIPIDPAGKEVGGLGQPVSHGCVRLAHEKAELLYEWAPNGTKVIVQK